MGLAMTAGAKDVARHSTVTARLSPPALWRADALHASDRSVVRSDSCQCLVFVENSDTRRSQLQVEPRSRRYEVIAKMRPPELKTSNPLFRNLCYSAV